MDIIQGKPPMKFRYFSPTFHTFRNLKIEGEKVYCTAYHEYQT